MKLKRLSLRGAIGIEKGLRLAAVEIDFERFSPGLLAFVGENGSGKTTILENLIPYPTMVSRSRSLYTHFYLEDSYRDLLLYMNGDEYRCLLRINAPAKKVEGFLYKNGTAVNDGKISTYTEEIVKVFGSEDLFFRSIFSAQNCPQRGSSYKISELTKGDKKELFVQMLGLERYQRYADTAKEKARQLEEQNVANQVKLEMIRERLQEEPRLKEEKRYNSEQLKDIENKSQAEQEALNVAKRQKQETEEKLTAQKVVQSQIEGLEQRIKDLERQAEMAKEKLEKAIEELRTDVAKIEEQIRRKEKLLENKELIAKNVAELETLIVQEQVMKKGMTKAAKLQEQINAINAKVSQINTQRTEFQGQIDRLIFKIQEAKKKTELSKKAPCTQPPKSMKKGKPLADQCPLLQDALTVAIEAEKELVIWEKQLKELNVKLNLIKDCDKFLMEKGKLEETKVKVYDGEKHETIIEKISKLQADKWPQLQVELDQAEETINSLKNQLEDYRKKEDRLWIEYSEESNERTKLLEQLENEIANKNKGIDFGLHDKLYFLSKHIEEKEQDIAGLQDEKTSLLSQIRSIDDQLGEMERLRKEQKDIINKTKAITKEIGEWKLLQRACGKDGIQALEIDNAGPGISKIGNSLLSSCFGSEFQLSFETTKMSSDQKKVLEVFDIVIWRDGEPMIIEDLSGGQKVWLERALSIAFATYIRENAGRQFETYFLDEEDGALDEENRKRYLQMLQAAHQLTGMYHTILISQSKQLTDQIQQRLELGDWGVRQVY